MSIAMECRPDDALLTLHGPVAQDSALALRQHLDQARGYWHYKRVVLEINSPGGELLALRAMAHDIHRWREQGGEFITEGRMAVASAAALALSLGDVGQRTVQPHTQLVYHHTRVQGNGDAPLTAEHAVAAAQQLNRADQGLLDALVNHLVAGFGGEQALGEAGLERCRRVQAHQGNIHKALGHESGLVTLAASRRNSKIGPPKLLRQMESSFQQALEKERTTAFRELLSALFAQDRRMPVDVAWALLLVDVVEGIPALQPRDPLAHSAAPEAPFSSGGRRSAPHLGV
jgi:ATP-dependent protease ClpP protease subunit